MNPVTYLADEAPIEVLQFVVRSMILGYFQGVESLAISLGDRAYGHRWIRDYGGRWDLLRDVQIRGSNHPDFRGLVCTMLDDLEVRNRDRRDQVLDRLCSEEDQTYSP